MIGDLAQGYCDLLDHLVVLLGTSRNMAHVHAGLAIYVIAQLATRDRRASVAALQWVLACAIGNEVLQALAHASPRWSDGMSDVMLTLMWPAILYAVGRHRRRRWMALQARIGANPIYTLRPATA